MKTMLARVGRILRPFRFRSLAMMLIIWTSVAGALFAGISSDMRSREYLRGRVQTIADSISADELQALNGDSGDLSTLAYAHLQDQLMRVRSNNGDLRYIYLLGQKQEGQVFYYMNSEVSSSPDYFSPGSVMSDGAAEIRSRFLSNEAAVVGPSGGSLGFRISAFAPVVDSQTHKTVALVGMDTSGAVYYGQILLYALVPLLLAAIPLVGLFRDMKVHSKEEELLQLKNQFVSISSHELRSPLTGMMWAIQSLSRSGAMRLNLEQLSMLGAMYHSVESSLATVNEILDFSIFDRGQAKIQREPVDVVAVIKQVVATLSLSAREKRLIIEPTGKWPRHVYAPGDVAALKRAFMNIFSNAIKYSNDSTNIEIVYQAGTNEHIIGIRDHGIGIPEAEKDKVLKGYYRASNATAVEVHGTGLGLLVTKKIVEQHGGRVWLESKVGDGTIIYVALPLIPDPNGTPETAAVAATTPVPAKSVDSTTQVQDSPSKDTPLLPPPVHG